MDGAVRPNEYRRHCDSDSPVVGNPVSVLSNGPKIIEKRVDRQRRSDIEEKSHAEGVTKQNLRHTPLVGTRHRSESFGIFSIRSQDPLEVGLLYLLVFVLPSFVAEKSLRILDGFTQGVAAGVVFLSGKAWLVMDRSDLSEV